LSTWWSLVEAVAVETVEVAAVLADTEQVRDSPLLLELITQ
jgi:hypothetical protein